MTVFDFENSLKVLRQHTIDFVSCTVAESSAFFHGKSKRGIIWKTAMRHKYTARDTGIVCKFTVLQEYK